MEFSNPTTKQGIVEDVDFILGPNNYTIEDKTRNINKWYNNVVSLILSSDGKMQWDDSNNPDYPIGASDLEAGTQEYNYDSLGVLSISRVEILDQNGRGVQLMPIDQEDVRGIAMSEFMKTSGNPQYYDVIGDAVFLYPTPNYNKVNGVVMYFQRGANYFEATDTTKKPGFIQNFHQILSYGASLEYCIAKNLSKKIPGLMDQIAKLEQAIIDRYSSRDKDKKVRFKIKQEDYGQDSDDFEGRRSVGWTS